MASFIAATADWRGALMQKISSGSSTDCDIVQSQWKKNHSQSVYIKRPLVFVSMFYLFNMEIS